MHIIEVSLFNMINENSYAPLSRKQLNDLAQLLGIA